MWHDRIETSLELVEAFVFLPCKLTYVFFGEDPREAQVTGHLGFEQSVFPQISIQTVGGYGDLDVVQGQEGKGHWTGIEVTEETGWLWSQLHKQLYIWLKCIKV